MAQLNDLIVNGNTRFLNSAYGNLVGSASTAINAGTATNALNVMTQTAAAASAYQATTAMFSGTSAKTALTAQHYTPTVSNHELVFG